MKKLIAISVVFALVAGVAFAVDLTGSVVGVVHVLEGTTQKDGNGDSQPVGAQGFMKLVRIDGAGETGDGDFGGYLRLDAEGGPKPWEDKAPGSPYINAGWAWWKPIDQFKLIIGSNSDSFWGKEGVTGWMFNQKANDGIAINPGIWTGLYGGGPYLNPGSDDAGIFDSTPFFGGTFMHNRYVFFEGFQYWGLAMEISPADIATINVGLPFISAPRGNEAADQFRAATFQLDLNFDFGNIAISYEGANRANMAVDGAGAIFLYYGGSFGDLSLDVGFSYHLPSALNDEKPQWGVTSDKGLPIGVGVGLKYATDSLGVKFRTTAALAGNKEGMGGDATYINTSVLPYFILGDNLAVFVNVGLGIAIPSEGDSVVGWFFNPYLRVGAEWGPSFYAGIQASSKGSVGDADATVQWAVPIALMVSF